ncbi:hypothetical protein [Methyloceanibacter sp.]|uniref:hypothetical protein n=1 Tax=Methyloceanibacter sp. TaxID=1965321 RepID=UPI003D6C7565
MDAVPGITVGECVGWKISSDKQTVQLAFRDTKGNPFNLVLGEGTLKDAIFALLDASEAFPKAKLAMRDALAAMLEPGV